jgi:Rrf2 family protein
MLSQKEIAAKENIPLPFLEQIFLQLREAGLVDGKRGKGGGFFLAKPANNITLAEVVRLIDGPLAPISCASMTAYAKCGCPDEAHCGLRMIMLDVRNSLCRSPRPLRQLRPPSWISRSEDPEYLSKAAKRRSALPLSQSSHCRSRRGFRASRRAFRRGRSVHDAYDRADGQAIENVGDELGNAGRETLLVVAGDRMVLHDRDGNEQHDDHTVNSAEQGPGHGVERQSGKPEESSVDKSKDHSHAEVEQ